MSLLGEKNFHEFHTNRNFELSIFNQKLELASELEIERLKSAKSSHLTRLYYRYFLKKAVPYYKKHVFYEQQLFEYDANINFIPSNCYLIGYWQNENYFINYKKLICEIFTFSPFDDLKNAELANQINSCNSVAVHIRRGDYVHNKNANELHGGIANDDYYKRALTLIKDKVGNPQFFVFSDEINWVRENMNFPQNTQYIGHNIESNSYKDMQLMSLCHNAIIPNSSFSWWAAWLNNHLDKIIVAPLKWFKSSTVNDSQVCPKSWIRI